jgi:hypothetical protein
MFYSLVMSRVFCLFAHVILGHVTDFNRWSEVWMLAVKHEWDVNRVAARTMAGLMTRRRRGTLLNAAWVTH